MGWWGLGLIGAATGRKAKGLGYKRHRFRSGAVNPGSVTEDGIMVVNFEDLIACADVISLHVPLNEHTHHLINGMSWAE